MYCIAGFGKVKDNQKVTQIASHNFRLHLTLADKKRVDSKRSHLNKILVNPLDVNAKNVKDLSIKIQTFYKKNNIEIKSNSVLAIDLMVTTSPEFFGEWQVKGKITVEGQKKIDDWVEVQLALVKKDFGEAAIKLAILHLDETTPHIHFLITPEQTKELKYKNQYGMQSKIVTSLNADRWNPNFWKKFLKNYDAVNKKFGLRKGEEGSMSEHINIKEYSKMVSEASKLDYSKAINKIIQDIGSDLSFVNTKDGVKRLLVEKLLPSLNPMLKQNKALKKLLELDRVNEYKSIKKMKDELKKAIDDALARKSLYIEAINEKGHDAKLLAEQQAEIIQLKNEVVRLKPKTIFGENAIESKNKKLVL